MYYYICYYTITQLLLIITSVITLLLPIITKSLLPIFTVIMDPLLLIITRSKIGNNGLIITYYWQGQLADALSTTVCGSHWPAAQPAALYCCLLKRLGMPCAMGLPCVTQEGNGASSSSKSTLLEATQWQLCFRGHLWASSVQIFRADCILPLIKTTEISKYFCYIC